MGSDSDEYEEEINIDSKIKEYYKSLLNKYKVEDKDDEDKDNKDDKDSKDGKDNQDNEDKEL